MHEPHYGFDTNFIGVAFAARTLFQYEPGKTNPM